MTRSNAEGNRQSTVGRERRRTKSQETQVYKRANERGRSLGPRVHNESTEKMTMASNIVVEWLRSLHLGQYSESFIDNGYDDLEICKQIGDPDLDAIGVFNQKHRARLLQSVKTLREEGAASVYFTLEETNDSNCDNISSKSSRTSSERPPSDKEAQRASPTASSSSGGQELTKFADEYEEGKAELVRIPRMQLRMLLQEKLRHDGIRLACQPYTTPVSQFTLESNFVTMYIEYTGN